MIKIERALISCWDKSQLLPLAQTLTEFKVEIISSGGTARYLEENGIPVTPVEAVTEFPEVLGGRVKTLHPRIHAGILATNSTEHQKELQSIQARRIQLVVVNLYPFVEEAVKNRLPLEKAIEYIDIGGPTLLRAAAKNFQYTVVLPFASEYERFIQLFKEGKGNVPLSFSREQAAKTFWFTTWYDSQITAYFDEYLHHEETNTRLPLLMEKHAALRYGENPHQKAAFYAPAFKGKTGMAAVEQLQGKQLSFNNYVDVDAAYRLVAEFTEPTVAIIKHTNPAGIATRTVTAEAFTEALSGDPVSAFGGIVALNRPVDAATAEEMAKIFFECIIAPDFEEEAVKRLKKKKNLRLLRAAVGHFQEPFWEVKSVCGGYLVNESDSIKENADQFKVVTDAQPTEQQWADLLFAWKVVKHVKSNAIVLAREQKLLGAGAGQMSRVDSVELAGWKAQKFNHETTGSVLASDAFFPFRDGIDKAAALGVTAIIQPGGSIRDEEVIQAANEHGIAMVFTGIRHFKH